MREESLIDFEQSLLVGDKEVKQIASVSHCEVSDLYSVLGECC